MTTLNRLLLICPICRSFPTLDTDDAIQECWLATRSLDDPRLVRLKTRHRCIDLWRRDKVRRRRVVTDSEVVEHHLEQQEDRDTEERKSDLSEIMDAVELSSFERDLLYRRYYRGQTVREIAAELGLAPTSIHLSVTGAEAKIRETTLEKGQE